MLVKANEQIFRTGIIEQTVMIDTVRPGSQAVFDSSPPGIAKNGAYFVLGGFAYFDRRNLAGRELMRGIAEEAPLAYKDVRAVIDVADRAGLAKKVARLEPVICIKG